MKRLTADVEQDEKDQDTRWFDDEHEVEVFLDSGGFAGSSIDKIFKAILKGQHTKRGWNKYISKIAPDVEDLDIKDIVQRAIDSLEDQDAPRANEGKSRSNIKSKKGAKTTVKIWRNGEIFDSSEIWGPLDKVKRRQFLNDFPLEAELDGKKKFRSIDVKAKRPWGVEDLPLEGATEKSNPDLFELVAEMRTEMRAMRAEIEALRSELRNRPLTRTFPDRREVRRPNRRR